MRFSRFRPTPLTLLGFSMNNPGTPAMRSLHASVSVSRNAPPTSMEPSPASVTFHSCACGGADAKNAYDDRRRPVNIWPKMECSSSLLAPPSADPAPAPLVVADGADEADDDEDDDDDDEEEEGAFTDAARMRLIVMCGPWNEPTMKGDEPWPLAPYSSDSSTDSLVEVKYRPRRLRTMCDSDVAVSSAFRRVDVVAAVTDVEAFLSVSTRST